MYHGSSSDNGSVAYKSRLKRWRHPFARVTSSDDIRELASPATTGPRQRPHYTVIAATGVIRHLADVVVERRQ